MWPLYAFDNYFSDADPPFSPEERWDLLRALGYDQGYLSTNRGNADSWAILEGVSAQRRRTGLGLAAVYTVVDLLDPQPEGSHSVGEMLDLLEPGDVLELAIAAKGQKPSDPAHDEAVLDLLAPLLAQARTRGVAISLYHHIWFLTERIEDCVRLAAKANDPALGVTYCGYHWYAVDRTDLAGKLRLAAPWMRLANLCGARPAPDNDFAGCLPATIEPVGEGDFPLGDYIAGLRAVGYAGPVGFQGYKIGGHPPDTLRRSVEAFRQAAGGE